VKLARFEVDGAVRLGAVAGSAVTELGVGDSVLDVLGVAAGPGAAVHALADVALLAPIARPPEVIAIGFNYHDHIAETGAAEPEFPVFFNKQSSCVVGHGAAIQVPQASSMVDYEGELGVVIGQRCRHVAARDAHEVVAGYLVVNDVSVRDWQFRSPTMTLGKSFDTHGPMGPWLVTADEIGDPHALRIRTWVGDDLLQDGHTSQMVCDVWQQIEVLTTVMTLEPGTVIATGTPAGVGLARQPPRWLVPGDTVRVEIDRVGVLENPVVAEPGDSTVA
jgi:2-keto-4-pentenoate hydratase/2-oxohepta-3-ene-1,7-dioic acid hydratase in catechol pathway